MRLRRAGHVAWRRVGDETVLIHLKKKRIYVLNPSGGFFWHQLDGSRDESALLGALALETSERGDAANRVASFLEHLREADLVETSTHEKSAASTPGVPSADYPFDQFVPPELIWQEEIRNFGASCAFVSGASGACDQIPTT